MFVGVRVAPVLAAAALVGVLAGCSGSSDEPRSLPPLSTTPVSTSSPAPPDTKTALAQAEAVVREYFRLLNAPTSEATATALEALMTKTCSCREVAKSTRSVARRGRHYFGRTHLSSMASTVEAPGRIEILADYRYTRSGIADATGRVLSSSVGRSGATVAIKLAKTNKAWLMTSLIYVRPGHRN